MNLSQQIAKHIREVHFGGNWTESNLKDQLADVTWEQAVKKTDSFNTIAALVYHINYFVKVGITVLKNESLNAHDKYSFNVPPVHSQADWQQLVNQSLADAETYAKLVEQLPESRINEIFIKEKYGNYFRNLIGNIEHMHYHLGQIVIIKKLVKKE